MSITNGQASSRKVPFLFKWLFLISCLLAVPFLGLAQEKILPNPIPPEPTAASLGKYGEIPVSLHTGIPDISIPIFNASGTKLDLPISLTYHAGGIKVTESASWVGLGWSLRAGGVINRQIKGVLDVADNGYFKESGRIAENLNTPTNSEDVENIKKFIDGTWDGQPDVFTFSFAGYSGRFLIKWDKEVKLITPSKKFKIEFEESRTTKDGTVLNTRDLVSFVITVENGTRYTFESTIVTDTKDRCTPFQLGGHRNYKFVSSWYLTKIESPGGYDEITLTYENFANATQANLVETLTQKLYRSGTETESRCDDVVKFASKRLKSIKTAKYEVVFDANTPREDLPHLTWMVRDRALDQIKIYNNENQLIKSFSLDYDYFESDLIYPADEEVFHKRLKLEKVTETGANGIRSSPYVFEYNENTTIPSVRSKGQDFWGFYNGKEDNSTLIPTLQIRTTARYDFGTLPVRRLIEGADRKPDFLAASFGLLKKIIYPTGGYTSFQYEGHDFNPKFARLEVPNDAYFNLDYDYTNYSINVPQDSRMVQVNNGISSGDARSTNFTLHYDQHITVSTKIDGPLEDENTDTNQRMREVIIYDSSGNEKYRKASVQSGVCDNTLNGCKCVNGKLECYDEEFFLPKGTYYLYVRNDLPTIDDFGNPIDPGNALILVKFEKNEFISPFQTPEKIGGFRVKQITSHDGEKATASKNYKYVLSYGSEASSGVLRKVNKFSYITYVPSKPGVGPSLEHPLNPRVTLTSYPSSGRNYSPIYYRHVIVEEGSNGENGRTEYSFLDPNQFDFDVSAPDYYPFPHQKSYSWVEGLNDTIEVFSRTGKLLQKTINKYNHLEDGVIKGYDFVFTHLRDGSNYDTRKITSEYASGYSQLAETIAYTYDQENDQAFTKSSTYRYKNEAHHELSEVTELIGNDEQRITRTLYPSDIRKEDGTIDEDVVGLIQNHVINTPVETQVWYQEGNGSDKQLTYAQKTTFSGKVLPDKVLEFRSESGETFTTPFPEDITFNDEGARYTYYPDGNVREIIRRDGITNVLVWGYHATLPIVEVVNATYGQVHRAIANSGTTVGGNHRLSGQAIRDKFGVLRSALPQSRVKILTYNDARLVGSLTAPNGRTTFYDYDCLNRLIRVKNHEGEILKALDYEYYNGIKSSDDPCKSIDFSYAGAGATLTFSPVYDDLNLTNFTWDFGDGTTSDVKEPTHTFSSVGPHTVTLTASGDGVFTKTKEVTLSIPQLTVTIDGSSGNIVPGQSYPFTAVPTGGSGVYARYEWWIDNNPPAQGGRTENIFILTGTYQVSVRVFDSFGKSATATLSLQVVPPQEIFIISPIATTEWERNRPATITWNHEDNVGSTCTIDLIKGTSSQRIGSNVPVGPGQGSFTWQNVNPSSGTGSGYKIRIRTNTGVEAESQPFRIGDEPEPDYYLSLNVSVNADSGRASASVTTNCTSVGYTWYQYVNNTWKYVGNGTSITYAANATQVRCTVSGCSISRTQTQIIPF
ncbi:MAG: PKD domain-containing protein [Bacteroidota bacterium]